MGAYKDTMYSYNKTVFVTLYAMLCFSVLCIFSVLTTTTIIRISVDIPRDNIIWALQKYSFVGSTVMDAIFSLVLLTLFHRKLVQLIKSYFVALRTYKEKEQIQLAAEQNVLIDEVILDEVTLGERTHSDQTNLSNIASIQGKKS